MAMVVRLWWKSHIHTPHEFSLYISLFLTASSGVILISHAHIRGSTFNLNIQMISVLDGSLVSVARFGGLRTPIFSGDHPGELLYHYQLLQVTQTVRTMVSATMWRVTFI